MSEFFTQALLNSFFCLFCKALSVLNPISFSNFSWQDPLLSNLVSIGLDLEPILVFRRDLPLRPHVVLSTPINPKAFDARHSGSDVVLTAVLTGPLVEQVDCTKLPRTAGQRASQRGAVSTSTAANG